MSAFLVQGPRLCQSTDQTRSIREAGSWIDSVVNSSPALFCLGLVVQGLQCCLEILKVLGGSWVVINGVISPLIWVISIVTLLITTHEPPSRGK